MVNGIPYSMSRIPDTTGKDFLDSLIIGRTNAKVVCYTAVFSVVGGALRDDTKNGCVAD